MKSLCIGLCVLLVYCGCQSFATTKKENAVIQETESISSQESLRNAYFASGCFWCVEAIYESVKGVEEVISGYSGGKTLNPTYRQVASKKTGHAETVKVIYNPSLVSYGELLKVYYASQNPTTRGQSPDFGEPYRSIIFYQNQQEAILAKEAKELVQEEYDENVVTEILPFEKFWVAEDYHQNFEKLHPQHSYIQRVSIPRLKRFQSKLPQLLKK